MCRACQSEGPSKRESVYAVTNRCAGSTIGKYQVHSTSPGEISSTVSTSTVSNCAQMSGNCNGDFQPSRVAGYACILCQSDIHRWLSALGMLQEAWYLKQSVAVRIP